MIPVAAHAKPILTFDGKIQFSQEGIALSLDLEDVGSFSAQLRETAESKYAVDLQLQHVKTPLFDVSTQISTSFQIVPEDKQKIKGEIWSNYSLVDYKPIRELRGTFEFSEGKITINQASIDHMEILGSVDLSPPFDLNLDLKLKAMDMETFLGFWIRNKVYTAAGDVYGKIKISGQLNKPFLSGALQSRDGVVGRRYFDSISVNLEGMYPYMQIYDSVFSEAGGLSYAFDGPLALNDLKNFKQQVKNLNFSPIVNESDSRVEWTIKRFQHSTDESTEIKYLRRKDDKLDSTVPQQQSEMWGVQRTMKF